LGFMNILLLKATIKRTLADLYAKEAVSEAEL
jgi:hypothetical protein